MAFILQGNYINGLEALSRTFLVTGAIVGADVLLKVINIYSGSLRIYIYDFPSLGHLVKAFRLFVCFFK